LRNLTPIKKAIEYLITTNHPLGPIVPPPKIQQPIARPQPQQQQEQPSAPSSSWPWWVGVGSLPFLSGGSSTGAGAAGATAPSGGAAASSMAGRAAGGFFLFFQLLVEPLLPPEPGQTRIY
jgi:hypothetical protein